METCKMTNLPAWVEPVVNDERRRLRETPRMAILSERVEAKIVEIRSDPGRERGRSAVFRLPRHPPVRASAVYGSGEGRLVLRLEDDDKVLIVGIVPTN